MSILNHFFDYKPEVLALDEKAMELCQPYFRHMEEIRDFNQLKMLKAFADTQMSSTDMLGCRFLFPTKRSYFYAKNKISKYYFYCSDGLLHGFLHDRLHHFTKQRCF